MTNNEFLFQLRADLSQFQQSMRQAAQIAGQAAKTISQQLNSTAGSFGNLNSQVQSSKVILNQYGQVLKNVGVSAQQTAAQTNTSMAAINQRVALLRNSMLLLNNQIRAAGGFKAFASQANMSLGQVMSMYKQMQSQAQASGVFVSNLAGRYRSSFDGLYDTIKRQVKLFTTWTIVLGGTMAALRGIHNAIDAMISKSSEFQVQGVLFNAYNRASANDGSPVNANTNDLLRASITLASRWGDEVNDVAQQLSLWTKRTGDFNAAQYMANQTLKFQLATGTQIEDQYRALTALSTQAPDIFGLDKTSKTLQMVTAAAVTAGAGLHQLSKNGDEMGNHLNNSAVILLEAMEKDAAALKSLGYGASDIIALNQALIQSFGNVGSGAQEAAEKIGRLAGGIARLGKPGDAAALAKAGIDVTGLTTRKDVLEQISKKWETLTKAQQDNLAVTLAGNRQYEALEAILGGLAEKNRILTSMKKNMNAEDELALGMQGTYEVQLKKVNAQWEGFIIAVGQGALPVLSSFISYLGNTAMPAMSAIAVKIGIMGDAMANFANMLKDAATLNIPDIAARMPNIQADIRARDTFDVYNQTPHNRRYLINMIDQYQARQSALKSGHLTGAMLSEEPIPESIVNLIQKGGAENLKNFLTIGLSGSNTNLASQGAKLSKEIEDALKRSSMEGTKGAQGSLVAPGVGATKTPKAPSAASETTAALDLLDLKYGDHIQKIKDAGEADDALARRMDHLIEVYGATSSNVAAANMAHAKKIVNDKEEINALKPLENAYNAVYQADLKKLNSTKQGTKAWIDAARATQDAHGKLSSIREQEQGLTDDIMNQTTAINENDKKMQTSLDGEKRKLEEMQNKIHEFGKAWADAYDTASKSVADNQASIMDSAIAMLNPDKGGGLQASLLKNQLEELKAIVEAQKKYADQQKAIHDAAQALGQNNPMVQEWILTSQAAEQASVAAAQYAKQMADNDARIKEIQNSPLYKATGSAFDVLANGIGTSVSNALFGENRQQQQINDIDSNINALQQQKSLEEAIYSAQATHSKAQDIAHKEAMIQIDQEIAALNRKKKAEEEQMNHPNLLKKVAQDFVKNMVDDFLKQMQQKMIQNLFHLTPDDKATQMVKDQKAIIEGPDTGSMKSNTDSLRDTIITNSQGLYQSMVLFNSGVDKLNTIAPSFGGAGGASVTSKGGFPTLTSLIGNGGAGALTGNLAATGALAGLAAMAVGGGGSMPSHIPGDTTTSGGGAAASKGAQMSWLQKAFGAVSAGMTGYGIASGGGFGNAVMGGLTGGLGVLASTGNPALAAGVGFFDFLSGAFHHDNPALMPDKYNTGSWGQDNANLFGAGFNGENPMHANGQSFTMDPTLAQATGGLGLLQYIGKWIDDNPDKAKDTLGDLYHIFKGENVPVPIPSGKNGTLNLANGVSMNWQELYGDAMQAMSDIQAINGQQNTQPIVGFTQMGGGSGFFPYSWNTPGYDIYNGQNNPTINNIPAGGTTPPPTTITPPTNAPPRRLPPGVGGGYGGGTVPKIGMQSQAINVYVSPEISLDGRVLARSNQAYSIRVGYQGYQYLS